MNITVYLGSSMGNDPIYKEAVTALGTWIGQNGHGLVYGGSNVGLMGVLSNAALDAGAHVIGVEPHYFVRSALQNDRIHELIVTETMNERKARLIELGDAYIAFPGGMGTLDEISEVTELATLAHFAGGDDEGIRGPVIYYNLNGFYDDLRAQMDKMTAAGFLPAERLVDVHYAGSLEEIAEILGA